MIVEVRFYFTILFIINISKVCLFYATFVHHSSYIQNKNISITNTLLYTLCIMLCMSVCLRLHLLGVYNLLILMTFTCVILCKIGEALLRFMKTRNEIGRTYSFMCLRPKVLKWRLRHGHKEGEAK